MIREDKFLISRKPYAIDLASVTGTQEPRGAKWRYRGTANALWYRRKNGITRACIGTLDLWSHYLDEPVNLDDPAAVLSARLDGRYGGDTAGRWDGTSYWGNVPLAVSEQHMAILGPMLAAFHETGGQPPVPAGHDGWWRFDA